VWQIKINYKQMKIVIYGSYGYSGDLIVQECLKQGLWPHLSGRKAAPLKAQSLKYNLPFTCCELNDSAFAPLVEENDVMVNCAGPFIHTAKQVIGTCVAKGTHYLDITGEYQVFEMAQKYHQKAKEKRVMILPGCGFDVVPSDCLALHLKTRLTDAINLQIAFAGMGAGMSRGTAKTMIEGMGGGGSVRKEGEIVKVSHTYRIKEIDFGPFKSKAVSIPWGDISTAYYSTGIPNITVFMAANQKIIRSLKLGDLFGFVLRWTWVKNLMKKKVEKRTSGPSVERRTKSRSYFWAEVSNDKGESKVSRLEVPDGYTLTAVCTTGILKKMLNGHFKSGFQTPSTAYGADFILEFPNCKRMDI
jgi:short subunit dehydrogenase-like uncharacterized protein